MEYCYSGTEMLWYENWTRHVCYMKQKCGPMSCLDFQFWPGNSQTLGCLWTKYHRYNCMWKWTELQLVHFLWEQNCKFCFIWVEKIGLPIEGRNLFSFEYRLFVGNVHQKPEHIDDVIFRAPSDPSRICFFETKYKIYVSAVTVLIMNEFRIIPCEFAF